MIAWEVILVLAALGVIGTLLATHIVLPMRQIRKTLRDLAERNYHATPHRKLAGLFEGSAQDLRKICENLEQLDRQTIDEGFSLRAILSSMVEGVLIADRSQRIRLVNEALTRTLVLQTSPLNRTVLDVFRSHELQAALERALELHQPQHLNVSLDLPSQRGGYEPRHLEVHVAGLDPKPHGLPSGLLVVFHDVTDVRNLEATRREFLANVSHEFRTPLAIINGYVETLLDGALEDSAMASRSLTIMQKNGQRLALLIEDLLTISRLEDRSHRVGFQNEDLRELLAHVLEHLEPNIRERRAQITFDWADDVRAAQVDGRRIEQVYSNLLGNALRYGDAAHLAIHISAKREGDDIHIAFLDNGPGIPYADQAHIFERFYRVHKDRSRDAGGTGLGLSIVKNIVQAHGGRVFVESTPGKGAAFHVVIPRLQPPLRILTATSVVPAG